MKRGLRQIEETLMHAEYWATKPDTRTHTHADTEEERMRSDVNQLHSAAHCLNADWSLARVKICIRVNFPSHSVRLVCTQSLVLSPWHTRTHTYKSIRFHSGSLVLSGVSVGQRLTDTISSTWKLTHSNSLNPLQVVPPPPPHCMDPLLGYVRFWPRTDFAATK